MCIKVVVNTFGDLMRRVKEAKSADNFSCLEFAFRKWFMVALSRPLCILISNYPKIMKSLPFLCKLCITFAVVPYFCQLVFVSIIQLLL